MEQKSLTEETDWLPEAEARRTKVFSWTSHDSPTLSAQEEQKGKTSSGCLALKFHWAQPPCVTLAATEDYRTENTGHFTSLEIPCQVTPPWSWLRHSHQLDRRRECRGSARGSPACPGGFEFHVEDAWSAWRWGLVKQAGELCCQCVMGGIVKRWIPVLAHLPNSLLAALGGKIADTV